MDKQEIIKGFVCANSLADASAEISEYYGEDNTVSLNLKYISDNMLLEIPKEIDIASIGELNRA